jgi:ribulose-phosphate 3-epimerase
MPTTFTAPPRTPLILPSILAADFARMGDQCRAAFDAGADALHLDVMDGHFLPNLTMGPDMCKALRKGFPGALLDAHLMVTDPAKHLAPFADAGASHFTFHVEACDGERARDLIESIRARGMTAGVAINPPTAIEQILPLVPHADLILIMSVNPGFAGQSFIEPVLSKARAIKPLLRADQRLEIDGGIAPATAPAARAAGCDALVVGSALFGKPQEQWRGIMDTVAGR